MAMSWIWAGMVILSLFCGLCTGNLDAVASAALNIASTEDKNDPEALLEFTMTVALQPIEEEAEE